jgi:protocatechuate 3,4-dioxygenase beta subunit
MKLAFILVCSVAFASGVAGQIPGTEKEPAKASLEGSVVKEPSGEPLKKAVIELIGHDQEEGGNYTATSDPEGHYKISGILPGRYSLFVERTGYIEVDKKRRRTEGIAISLEAGQELKDQVLHMLPAAIIAGRVLDEDGDPMPKVQVSVVRRKWAAGRSGFEPNGQADTNDLGEYRIGGLMAGKYYVVATPLPSFQSLVPAQKSPEDPTAATPAPDLAYITTYYPTTADWTQASEIELHAGDDMPVDFSLTRTHTVHVRGLFAGLAAGEKAMVMLRSEDSRGMYITAEVGKDGKFEIPLVAPGSCTLLATTEMGNSPQIAHRKVEVTDADMDGLRLLPLPCAIVRGRVHFSGKGPKIDLSLLFVRLQRSDGEDDVSDALTFTADGSMGSPGTARVRADGSFELKNVLPGTYSVEVTGDTKAINDSFVESVTAGTKDATDSGLSVGGGTIAIEVAVSLESGALDGRVANDKNEPVANAVVVAVPESRYRKQGNRYQRVTTDQAGRFSIRGLRPGEYKLFAWEVMEEDEFFDPEYLKSYEDRGTAIHLEKSGHKSASLKVIPAPADQP